MKMKSGVARRKAAAMVRNDAARIKSAHSAVSTAAETEKKRAGIFFICVCLIKHLEGI